MPTIHEQLSEQFYKWESRGRGWQVFAEPVYPEPPFQPFRGYRLQAPEIIDDGRRPTFFSSLLSKFSQPPPKPVVTEESEPEPEPTPLVRESLVEFQASLPAKLDVGRESFEQFFHNLVLCREPVAFELLGIHKCVLAQFAANADDAPSVGRQLKAHFPDVQFRQVDGALDKAWAGSGGDEAFAVEFGLEREFMLPLTTGKMDPFVGLIGALAELQPGELALFQVLWQPVQNPWAESLVNSVSLPDGKPLFVNAPELTGAAENKSAKPLYAAVVRIMGRAATRARLEQMARDMAGSLRVFSNPQGNALIPLHNDDYPYEEHLEDVLRRQCRRSGIILTGDELTGFVHLPSSAVRSPVLLRDTGLTKAAPAEVRQPTDFVIGDNEHNGETVPVFLTADQRVRHTHIIGANGTGKSSLLLNLIRQDIANGDGLAVLDPHGDLIDQILGFIPEDRMKDVVLVDPSDVEFPVGFNILQAHSEEEKRLIASDLVGVFRRLATSWGDQMDTVLQNAILVILESSRGGTLADLRRFLLEPAYRTEFLQSVQDPELIYYWQKVFPQLGGGKSIGSVLTRLQDFFSQKPLRNMVSQRNNLLDFADIMDRRKIFLAKLSEGLCGEENSYLLGTLLVSKFQQLAMARQSQKVALRQDFWLYIDEFHHFITPSMAKILTGARKYRIGLTLAHQELHQLQGDAKVASAVMTQPCTRIVLRVGDDDAKKLGDGFESFDTKSLTRLEKFHAIVRVERNDFDFNLALRKPEVADGSEELKAAIIAASRDKYARPRSEVEAVLMAALRPDTDKPKPPEPPTAGESPVGGREPGPKPTAPAGPPAVPATPLPPPDLEPAKAAEIPNPTAGESKPVAEPKELGRGKVLHKTIQKRLKEGAQKIGFLSAAEKQLHKDSNEAADLVLKLQGTGLAIAVEIAISRNTNHEFENVEKCLAAGFARVAVIATGRKLLDDIAAAVLGGLGPAAAAKVSYHTPDEFLVELQKLAKTTAATPVAKTENVLGFKVTRNFPKLSPEEQRLSQQSVHAVAQKAIQK
jgi:Type IV secretion-system coupling protein DNA-binding domain